ncbi:MAG: histidine kinase [Cyanobacteria bacterium CRU_2_1]|nr:histidine kinase [Cyanobacteria bacterium RU_5_0]NJR59996.1 histidine kinase [Cyanobacteria bacterium CRU_2_1]
MNSLRSADVSLYELAISSEPSPQPLQISPTTFKSLIGILFDLLIEQQVSATIWLKLPRGEVWQAEVERFRQSATALYSLYNLHTYQETSPGKVPGDLTGVLADSDPSEALRDLSMSWDGGEAIDGNGTDMETLDDPSRETSIEANSRTYSLPLAVDSQLKREYFVLVVSPEFYGLILAHRPRSVRLRHDSQESQKPNRLNQMFEEGLEQKHPLLGICSFDQSTVKSVLDGVNRAIQFGQPTRKSDAEVEALVLTWEQLIEQGAIDRLSPTLLGRLLTKQIQRQEEMWRSGAVYRRQAETATAFRQENEELVNALRIKDEFVKTMGQELRTPLTNMKTALSLLHSPHLKPPQRQRYMDMLSHECDRQSSLITSVLDLVQLESTVEPIPMEPLRLTDIVPGVVSTYQPLAQEKGLMLGYTISEDLPPVSSVASWLRQIVINLLHNSIKFTPSGGQVWVKAKPQGDFIQIDFRDTGVGIPQAELPKIFDRFYRVRGSGEDSSGAGLGLSIVQQLLLRCGGSISVKSKSGEGSIFSVLLSVYEQTDSLGAGERVGGRTRET